jgi:NAD(P)-dependent dehydrogenase (short-subunit alcohol dehydrogenase family)
MTLSGQVILITGAGGGVGSMSAMALAKEGAHIVLLDKNLAKLEKVYDAITEANSPEPMLYPFDLAGASEAQYQDLADAIMQHYGSLQGLLHAAVEFSAFTPLQLHSIKDWGHTLNVNLNSPFLLTQMLLPALQNSPQASIVFISDSNARKSPAYSGAYAISKLAIEGLAKIFAEELQAAGKIRVNTLIPGPIDSPLRKRAYPAENKSQRRPISSLEPAIKFLFSTSSSYRSGETINADDFIT